MALTVIESGAEEAVAHTVGVAHEAQIVGLEDGAEAMVGGFWVEMQGEMSKDEAIEGSGTRCGVKNGNRGS